MRGLIWIAVLDSRLCGGGSEAARCFCGRGSSQGDSDPRSQQHDFPADDLNVQRFELCVERIDSWFMLRQTTSPLTGS